MRYLSQPPVPPFRDVGAGDGDDWFLEDIVVPYHRFDPDLLPSRPAFAGRNLVGVAPQGKRCGLDLDRYCQFLDAARGVELLDDLGLRIDRSGHGFAARIAFRVDLLTAPPDGKPPYNLTLLNA